MGGRLSRIRFHVSNHSNMASVLYVWSITSQAHQGEIIRLCTSLATTCPCLEEHYDLCVEFLLKISPAYFNPLRISSEFNEDKIEWKCWQGLDVSWCVLSPVVISGRASAHVLLQDGNCGTQPGWVRHGGYILHCDGDVGIVNLVWRWRTFDCYTSVWRLFEDLWSTRNCLSFLRLILNYIVHRNSRITSLYPENGYNSFNKKQKQQRNISYSVHCLL